MVRFLINCVLGILIWVPVLAVAADNTYTLIIKNHQFEPAQLTIPANQKVKILIENQDPTPEEFDSIDLNREKVISGNSKGIVFVGPLKPGQYEFIGEFHADTAKGVVMAQ